MENQQAVAAGILRDCCLSSTSVVGLCERGFCERGFSLGPTSLGQPVQTNPSRPTRLGSALSSMLATASFWFDQFDFGCLFKIDGVAFVGI